MLFVRSFNNDHKRKYSLRDIFNNQILKDGQNLVRLGTYYLFDNKQITNISKLTVQMLSEGGL